jgi:hypothetical protein
MPSDRHSDIEECAYFIWQTEGQPTGRDLDHWLRAEAEIAAHTGTDVKEAGSPRTKARRRSAAKARPKV